MKEQAHAVLDTNILVSGLLSPFGPPGAIVDALLARQLAIAIDDRIWLEYQQVLSRPKFGFSSVHLETLFIALSFQPRVTAKPWPHTPSPDPQDTMFLEVTAAANAPLVTGNIRHFPPECRSNLDVWTPVEFLERRPL